MTVSVADRADMSDAHEQRRKLSSVPEDRALLRAAAELTRDLVQPKPAIYWADFLGSALVGYAGVALAILGSSLAWQVAGGMVAVLALYRAGLFIHEITHVRRGALPGFKLAWNIILGVPMMVPSFMYEGLHAMHHNRTKYGTAQDPEYLPLALMKWWTIPVFVAVSVLAPVALVVRFGIIGPISMLVPPLRRFVVARFSGLLINPEFRRRAPEGQFAREWAWQEAGASLWAMTLIAGTVSGLFPWRAVAIFLGILGLVMLVNQVRTLVAHLWENDGDELSVTAQFLDTVNVPPPGLLPELWAPVGLRYHATHHLLPGLPYHALPEAHRRLVRTLGTGTTYDLVNRQGAARMMLDLMRERARVAAA